MNIEDKYLPVSPDPQARDSEGPEPKSPTTEDSNLGISPAQSSDYGAASSRLERQKANSNPLSRFASKIHDRFMILTHRAHKAHTRFNRLSPAEKKLRMVKWLRWGALTALGAVILGVIAFFIIFAYFSRQLPEPGEVVRRDGYSTRIYDREGNLLYDLYDNERRVPVTIDQIPQTLRQATIAIEDKDFEKHQGFDFLTLLRIPYNILFNQRVVGGSTLTQQLVKLVLLTNERSVVRKFKELVLAIQLERTFTKDEIITMYLNEVPYGGTSIGVGTAAEMYFGKPVSELNLLESAILAGLPQRPTAYSPYSGQTTEDGEPLWQFRTRGVLRRMLEDGYITQEQHDQAIADMQTITFQQAATNIKAPHFVMYVRDQLIDMFGEDIAERGGLNVTTTLDSGLQEESQKIVAEEIEKVQDFNITNGAALVMQPQTGQILSMVGSKDYFSEDIPGQFNVAVDGLRQPGSAIKPLTYLAMFQRGYNPSTVITDVATTFTTDAEAENPYQPRNYDGQFRGPVTIRNSLGSSLNIPAVKSLAIVGLPNFLQLAYDMGLPTFEPTPANLSRYGLALTLGGGEVRLIDLVTAYSAFANGGKKVEPTSILKVEDKDGRIMFEAHPVEGRQVIKPEEAFLINDILSDNNARLLAFGANSLLNTGKPIAVKTGTTNEQKDNWTIGWTQDLIAGVWVGNNDNSSMTRVASGITGASPIWRRIVNTALEKGYQALPWEVPANIERVEVDAISGYPAHDGYPTRQDYFIKGTVPQQPDPIHTKLKLCRGQQLLANTAAIAAGDYDEQEFIVLKEDDPVSQDGVNRWQEGINAWIAGQTDPRYKFPTQECGQSSDVFIQLRQPVDNQSYSSESIPVEVEAASDEGIDRIEIWVDGSLRETIRDRRYSGNINMPAGSHEIFARAFSRGGREIQSGTAHIGSGGQNYQAPAPSPSPSP